MLLLDVSLLQQPVLPLEVSVLSTEGLLPLNVSFLQHSVLPVDVCLLYKAACAAPGRVSSQQSVLSLDECSRRYTRNRLIATVEQKQL